MSTAQQTFLPEHFINRELSWLEFNARVLEEAEDAGNPLLERAKFLAIFASNLDEFFMVRVAGLARTGIRRHAAAGSAGRWPQTAGSIAAHCAADRATRRAAIRLLERIHRTGPGRSEYSIHAIKDLDAGAVKSLEKYFRQIVFPVLTPMAIDPAHPSPRFHNRGLYLAAMLERVSGIGPPKLFAVVQVPQVLSRFVPVVQDDKQNFVMLEDLIASRLPDLFGGYKILDHGTFRLTRDMDVNLWSKRPTTCCDRSSRVSVPANAPKPCGSKSLPGSTRPC